MSTIAAARIPDADNDRLVALAQRKGMKRPELVRRVLALGLERAERELDTEPLTASG